MGKSQRFPGIYSHQNGFDTTLTSQDKSFTARTAKPLKFVQHRLDNHMHGVIHQFSVKIKESFQIWLCRIKLHPLPFDVFTNEVCDVAENNLVKFLNFKTTSDQDNKSVGGQY